MELSRVVITGLGALTPIGKTVQDFWKNAIAGQNGSGEITKFDATHFKTKFACEIKGFEPETYLTRKEIKRSDLFTQYALYASAQAIEDSALELDRINPFDIGVIWGTGQGGMTTFEEELEQYYAKPVPPRFHPLFVPKLIANMASGMISIKFGLQGINYTTVSACATSNSAIMDAFNYIRLGKAKVILTGGSEAPISPASMGGFGALKALSTQNEDWATASRPFDESRNGFVMGEGAGALVLESYEHAKQRGAKIYGEIIGAAMTADAYHMTATHPEGLGAATAMKLALAEAKVEPSQVDYLNAHATSTPLGDPSEITAIQSVFGLSSALTISATKSMTGHLLGAAGAIESILSILSIQENKIPATINTQTIDPAFPPQLNILTGASIEKEVNIVVNNTFGFGGHNAILVFKGVS